MSTKRGQPQFQCVVDTAVGPVAVARPATEDGVDVISVIAAPGIAASQVWAALDEVVATIDDGRWCNKTFPEHMAADEVARGHAWTSQEIVQEYWGDAPTDGSQVWEARLPEWSVTESHDLGAAPGLCLVAEPLQALLPERSDSTCQQSVRATYDEEGFSAAAVTALGIGAGMPQVKLRTVQQVTLNFDRPHAVIAIARGGAWDGIPLFHAWVDPKERTTYE